MIKKLYCCRDDDSSHCMKFKVNLKLQTLHAIKFRWMFAATW